MSHCKSSTIGAGNFDDEVDLSLQTETVRHLLTLARLQSHGISHTTTHNHILDLQRDVDSCDRGGLY